MSCVGDDRADAMNLASYATQKLLVTVRKALAMVLMKAGTARLTGEQVGGGVADHVMGTLLVVDLTAKDKILVMKWYDRS